MRFLFDFFVFLFICFLGAGVIASFIFLDPSFLFVGNWDIPTRFGITLIGGVGAFIGAMGAGEDRDKSPYLHLRLAYYKWQQSRLLVKDKPKPKTLDDLIAESAELEKRLKEMMEGAKR